jgi:hypothetical protein
MDQEPNDIIKLDKLIKWIEKHSPFANVDVDGDTVYNNERVIFYTDLVEYIERITGIKYEPKTK